ncbi:MAG: hypothetical protein U0269_30465 [Polyangiales bacterium]
MNARQPDEPIPFLTKEERDALVLEFQRLAARLAQARLIAPATSTRLMRTIHRERRLADERKGHLADLVFNILVSIEDGTPTQFRLRKERRTHGAARWSDRGAVANE